MTFKFYLRMVAAAIATLLLAVGCSDDKTDDPNPDPDPDPTVDCTFNPEVYDITDASAFVKANPSDKTVTYHVGVAKKSLYDTFASDKAFQSNDVEVLKKEAEDFNMTVSEYLKKSISVGDVPTMFANLESETEYYAYVYGITENGDVTTDLAKKEFKTIAAGRPMTFEINVTGITPYGANVAVKPSGTSTYYYDVFEKAEMDKFANDAAIIAELEKSSDFEKGIVKGSQDHTYGEGAEALKPKTEYYAYAFEYGNPNVPAPKITKVTFTTKSDEPFNPTYASWLGKWKVESASSLVKGAPVTYEVEITQKVAGVSYNLKGWGITTLRNTPVQINYIAQDTEVSLGDKKILYKAGSLIFVNDQNLTNPDAEGYFDSFIGYLDYGDPKTPAMIVTGNYYPLSGVLTDESTATVVGIDIPLQDGSSAVIVGADAFVRNGNKFGMGEPTAGYEAGNYPVAPYTLTKIGEVDPPTPPVGDLTFGIALSNITETSVSVAITPSNNTDSYYFDLVPSSFKGLSDADVIATIEDAYAEYGLINLVSVGPDGYDWNGLTAGATYYVVAFGYDATGATTAITWKEVILTGGGENPDDLQFDITATNITHNAADIKCTPKNNNTGTYFFNFAKSSIIDPLSDTELFNALKGDGFVADDLFSGPVEYPAAAIAQQAPLDPGTEYTVYAFGVDVATQQMTTSRITRYKFTTTTPTEASEAYKAWLGTWTITSASSEVNNAPISFDVTIAEKAPDVSFDLTGWSILSVRTVPVTVNFKSGNLVVPNELFITQIDLNGSDDGKGKVYYKSRSLVNLPGQQPGYGFVGGTYDAITAKMGANKTSATATGYAGNLSQGGTFTVTGVDFFTEATVNGKTGWYNVYDPATGFTANDFPVGPFTMVKKSNNTAPMGAPAQYNLSSVLTASNFLVSTKRIAAEASLDAAKPALIANNLAVTNRSGNGVKNLTKLVKPNALANDMLTLGKATPYKAAAEMQILTGSVNNLLRPIKKVEAAYKLGTVRNE